MEVGCWPVDLPEDRWGKTDSRCPQGNLPRSMVGLAFALVAVALFAWVEGVWLGCIAVIISIFSSLASPSAAHQLCSSFSLWHFCICDAFILWWHFSMNVKVCRGVPQFHNMRDGINIWDMLKVLAVATLHPSPVQAIFRDPFCFSGKTVCIQREGWVFVIFRSCEWKIVCMFPVWMTQSFVWWMTSALCQEESQKDTIHQMYHLLQTSQLPASLYFGLRLVSSLTGNV